MRAGGRTARDSNGSTAMSVGATGKSPSSGTSPGPFLSFADHDVGASATDRLTLSTSVRDNVAPPIGNVNHDNAFNASSSRRRADDVTIRSSGRNNNGVNNRPSAHGAAPPRANSWVRESMRRIRHLRLPEAERSGDRSRIIGDSTTAATATILSSPNSLPDIALIAPEILAAHTNGLTSGSALRPSSAPVASRDHLSRSPGNAGTPRRGPRHGSRSRGGRHQERTSRLASASRAGNTAGDNAEIGVQTGSSAATSPARRRTSNGPPQHPATPAATSVTARR